MANEVSSALTELPMSQLIGAPLTAACEAQLALADASIGFIDRIAFDKEGKARLVKMELERPVVSADLPAVTSQTIKVEAPLLGLVPIPALLIEDVQIDFQMEITANSQVKDKIEGEVTGKASGGFFGVKWEVSGRVASSRESTRSTNQTAKYQVRVNARQQAPTEGLSKLMDVMAQCTEPIVKPSTAPTP